MPENKTVQISKEAHQLASTEAKSKGQTLRDFLSKMVGDTVSAATKKLVAQSQGK